MSSTTNATAYPFVRRRIGRAPSPPTWACYEQIPYDDDYSDSGSEDNSCSEDDEDYGHVVHHGSDVSDGDRHGAHESEERADRPDGGVEIDETDEPTSEKKNAELKKDVKGKQRAIEPEPESPRREHRRKRRQPVYTLRPILTIQRSQGFVWNQDLFIPPYIKDRYVASTSPNGSGFISSSVSSANSSMMDYEVEVVEIRVKEGELNDIIPQ